MKILRELGMCFFIGGMPMILMSIFSGNDQMLIAFSKLSPKDEIIWYFASLLGIYTLIYGIDHLVLKTNENVVVSFQKARSFFFDVGFSLLGIFRALAGAVPTALAILILKNGFEGALPSILLSSILVTGSFIACLGLSAYQQKSKQRTRFITS